jgi:hypothetical protein
MEDAPFVVLAVTCFAVVLVAFKVVFDSLLEAHQHILDLARAVHRLERLSRERSHRIRARVRVVELESRSTRATVRQLFGVPRGRPVGVSPLATERADSEEWRLG